MNTISITYVLKSLNIVKIERNPGNDKLYT